MRGPASSATCATTTGSAAIRASRPDARAGVPSRHGRHTGAGHRSSLRAAQRAAELVSALKEPSRPVRHMGSTAFRALGLQRKDHQTHAEMMGVVLDLLLSVTGELLLPGNWLGKRLELMKPRQMCSRGLVMSLILVSFAFGETPIHTRYVGSTSLQSLSSGQPGHGTLLYL